MCHAVNAQNHSLVQDLPALAASMTIAAGHSAFSGAAVGLRVAGVWAHWAGHPTLTSCNQHQEEG